MQVQTFVMHMCSHRRDVIEPAQIPKRQGPQATPHSNRDKPLVPAEAEAGPVQELGANAALLAALLGLVAAFAEVLGPRLALGGRLLRPVLAPTVQQLQSSCPAVRDAARDAAAALCRFCGYADLQVCHAVAWVMHHLAVPIDVSRTF